MRPHIALLYPMPVGTACAHLCKDDLQARLSALRTELGRRFELDHAGPGADAAASAGR